MTSTPLTLPPPSSPLTPHVRSQINTALLTSNSIPKIQAALLHECQASGFITALRARCLELLRSGECASYGELMGVVMQEVRGDNVGVIGGDSGGGSSGGGIKENGVNGTGTGKKEEGRLRVPKRVVEEGVGVVKSALEGCVVFGEETGS
ncbi:MAG: hypothetical protein MMC23_006788 [Stictis urceolatum]|nr:hypothetical protein [Stictis urceolata]